MIKEIMLIILIGYSIGSIPFSYILPKLVLKTDITKLESKNVGATNVFRQNKLLGICAFLLDASKGLVSILLIKHFFDIPYAEYIVLASVVLGHCFPIWLKFKGGKGIATVFGGVLIINWKVALTVMVIFIIVMFLTKIMSVSTITASLFSILFNYIYTRNIKSTIIMTIIVSFLIYKHKDNIKRIVRKEEKKLKFKN